jgi:SAM-dependent methyltransferase
MGLRIGKSGAVISALKNLLAHPLTRGMDINDPCTTELRREILQQKPFLSKIYEEWYRIIAAAIPAGSGRVLELGSGAGFMRERIPDVIGSEVFFCSHVDLVLDARQLPFQDASLRAIVMTDVLHHIPDVAQFLREALRCLCPMGRIVMVEPWVTPWSSLIYRKFHHEPFAPEAPEWNFPETGPLSGANGALPWMVFGRDRERFQREFSEFLIEDIQPLMPFSYLLSGGVSMRSIVPGWMWHLVRVMEKWADWCTGGMDMFAAIVITRR